jgi:arylsulfate sulfotransferase
VVRKLFVFALLFAIAGCKKDKKAEGNSITAITSFNIPADSVKLDPFGNAPLSALLKYNSTAAGHTEIVVEGQDGDASSITQDFNDSGLSHAIPIVGLYPDYNNIVDVYLVNSGGTKVARAVLNIKTAPLPQGMPNYIHIDNYDYADMEPGLNLVSNLSNYPAVPDMPYIIDNYGKMRWYLYFANNPDLKQLFYDCGINRLQNGNYFFADRASAKIYEIDILGKILHTWTFPGYDFHHNVIEKPNGNFLITVDKHGSTNTEGVTTYEDYVLEIDRNSNQILNEWDLKQSLDEHRRALSTDPSDWIHCNGLAYDASDNTIIVSGRVQGVVKLTADNRVKWILGPHKGWGKNRRGEDLNQFLLTPLDASGNKITDTSIIQGYTNHPDFEWNWYQHCPIIMPTNGDLMLFDNGGPRNFNPNSPLYSRAVEYKIDPVNMTVQQKWEYGKERGQDTYSMIISSVQYLKEKNHVLFCPGFYVPIPTGNTQGGKIIEVDYATKNLIYQVSIGAPSTFGWHRAYRMPIYPNNNSYNNSQSSTP